MEYLNSMCLYLTMFDCLSAGNRYHLLAKSITKINILVL